LTQVVKSGKKAKRRGEYPARLDPKRRFPQKAHRSPAKKKGENGGEKNVHALWEKKRVS